MKIGNIRLLDIKVILNDSNIVYEGAVSNAPAQVKEMQYDKIQVGTVVDLYVYDN